MAEVQAVHHAGRRAWAATNVYAGLAVVLLGIAVAARRVHTTDSTPVGNGVPPQPPRGYLTRPTVSDSPGPTEPQIPDLPVVRHDHRLKVLAALYYAGLAVVLLGIFTKLWAMLLPGRLADAIDFNSEGFVVALVLGAWVQFVRPRLKESSYEWPVTGAAAAASVALGIALYAGTWPSWFKTLNEAFLAIGVAIVYLQPRRPIPLAAPLALSGAMLAAAVIWGNGGVVGSLAEGVGVLFLVPFAFDIVDRGILDPTAVTRTRVRYGWYGFLVAIFLVVSALMHSGQLSGWEYQVAHYINRSHECIIGVLLLQWYFALALGRTDGSRLRLRALIWLT